MPSLHPMDVAEAEDREAAKCDSCDGTGKFTGVNLFTGLQGTITCPDCNGTGYLEPNSFAWILQRKHDAP